jgi:hypothetical protein
MREGPSRTYAADHVVLVGLFELAQLLFVALKLLFSLCLLFILPRERERERGGGGKTVVNLIRSG